MCWTLAFSAGLLAAEDEPASRRRTILPPAAPEFRGKIETSYKDSVPDWRPAETLSAPAGAPNVLMVVLDDVGFGHLGCYGGPVETPHLDQLASHGLRYTNFHTTALCSPSRGALLTGRNHHAIGLAAITEAATGFPGNYGAIPKSAALVSETLRQNGYNTMALGKWHLTPYTAYTSAGPFDRWPLGQGFEKFYGFLGGETDQWAPLLVQDNTFIETPSKPGYHLTADLVDRTMLMIRDQQQANTGRPFFAYLALGANHAPLHAPPEFIQKYRGRFDQGWDQVREETLARQKALGIVPAATQLAPRDPQVRPWAELNETQRRVYCRLQETYAGMLDHADHHLGRLLTALDELGVRDNTLILVVSDNGASQEGLQHGVTNTDRYRNFFPEPVEEMVQHLDAIGSPSTDPHYPMGWGLAGNTPFKKWKQDTHAGGNTDPLIVSWPARIKQAGQVRSQYHHLVDIVPTILEVTGLPAPEWVNGVKQMPLHGVSMAYSFDDASAKTRKQVQYYEMLGSRAIWSDGWTAVAWHQKDTPWEQDRWELYAPDDVSQVRDLAAKMPDRLRQLQALWTAEAKKYQVLPLDDRRYERAADPGRPVAAIARKNYTFYPGTSILHPLAAPQLLGKEHTITAHVDIPDGGAEGVLACSGGEFGGWALFVQEGKLRYDHNYLKVEHFDVTAPEALTAGQHTLGVRFVPTETHDKPSYFVGNVALLVDGQQVAEREGIKAAGQYSAMTGYGLLIGRNSGTPVSHDYQVPFAFTGQLDKVTVELK
ncbi:MAG: arylsulfatase [Pirellulales bacterium]